MKKFFLVFILILLIGCKTEGTNVETTTVEDTSEENTTIIVDTEPEPEPEPEVIPEPVYVDFGELFVEQAKTYLHVVEKKDAPNRGPEIDKCHDYAGLPYGNPWCLMFVNYVMYEVLKDYGFSPYIKTARVAFLMQYALKNKHNFDIKFAKGLLYGVQQAEPGDMPIWISGVNNTVADNFNGHIGFVIEETSPGKFKTIEGNTGPGNTGSQREGDGVYIRNRSIILGSNFRIEALIQPIYPQTEVK